MTVAPVQAINPIVGPNSALGSIITQGFSPSSGPGSFAQMLMNGVDHVNQKVMDAEKLATDFALDDSVPLHNVTYALQEARLSVELMLQVRTRLLDAYQQLAGMQL